MTTSRQNWMRAICFALAIATLSACGKDQVRPAMIQPIRDPQRLEDAVALLEAGNARKAQKTLAARMRKDPTDQEASLLLRSITEDPQIALGVENFAYIAQGTDSYQSLAQRYLGDRLKFYTLMRYNGSAQASLKRGDILKIPGRKEKEAVATEPPREARPARRAAPKTGTRPQPPKAVKSDLARAAQLRAAGLNALNRGDVSKAVANLRAAAAAAPDDALIKRDLSRAERLYKTVRAKG